MMKKTTVKIALLQTSDRQQFGRVWTYPFWHETEELFHPDYWGRALGRLRHGDTIRAVRLDDKRRPLEVVDAIVASLTRGGAELRVLLHDDLGNGQERPPAKDPETPKPAKRMWKVGPKVHAVVLGDEEVAAYPDKGEADAHVDRINAGAA